MCYRKYLVTLDISNVEEFCAIVALDLFIFLLASREFLTLARLRKLR